MRLSKLFTKTLREFPKDEESINAKLLIKGGFIHKVMAGVYEYLPLGWRVIDKINQIVEKEMDALGGQKLLMSILQSPETWKKTGRWESAKDTMYKTKDDEFGLGWTFEEPLTLVAKQHISSYKDLPKAVYQVLQKFRNEHRARSGLIRGKEFLMKDLYSFHADEADLDKYYEKVADSYIRIFKKVGLDAKRTKASGGLFSDFSDEFQVITNVGEDTIFYCKNCEYAANKEVADKINLSNTCPECKNDLGQVKSIEVGNIFKLGTRFSEAFGLYYTDKDGERKAVIMASYGLGQGRLMGTIVEIYNDEKGIIWPESVAPFKIHLIVLDHRNQEADKIYEDLTKAGIEVLYDDRIDESAGEKFADADLIGCPFRVVVSGKTLEDDSAEVKKRTEPKSSLVKLNKLSDYLR
ncbi:MAG: aminoacyl--tRNA ligase-related protein [Patescibacteria group bacterium]